MHVNLPILYFQKTHFSDDAFPLHHNFQISPTAFWLANCALFSQFQEKIF